MKRIYFNCVFILLFFYINTFCSCKQIPNDGIPSYISIDSIGLTTTADSQGAPSIYSQICWIEAGPENIGGWQIPAKIPILQKGKTTVRVFSGVYLNAISEYNKYPFFDFYETEIDLVQKESVTIFPKVKYKSTTKFSFIENFELTSVFDDFVKVPNPDNDYKGKFYGMLQLKSTSEKKSISNKLITVPVGKQAYLEFDYKTEDPGSVFFVSFYYATQSDNTDVIIQLSSTAKWKRAYLPISEDIGSRGGLPFNLMFTLIKKDEQSQSSILIDNIKIVNF